ncbi:MAG: acylphosphatase [Prolixibacteraceae bacterium]|nr:acylphosphatase [Prolixibacteraceae bacterium]MBT6004689.1 acylphosphatase [Prolixibacteraceae bacterium]MBT6765615.1 acylphosphatase [Prolixibacteraceae bacterium]MBT7000069.1 acylphosphatase [Prolixibacteraceae bacterium]MBT7396939.1 acylphosphatase [Prolixibacteraceae bacterium]
MVQYEIKVTGRVQGVGFRYYALQKAKEFGLNGWVKNTVDRGVLILVQGDETEIETFIDYLRIGPTRSRVNKISKYKMEVLSDFDNFSVKY